MENMLGDRKNCFSTSTPIYLAIYRNHPPHSAMARSSRFRDPAEHSIPNYSISTDNHHILRTITLSILSILHSIR